MRIPTWHCFFATPSNVKCDPEESLDFEIAQTMQHRRKPPNAARAKSLVEMMIGKKMFQWPSSTDSVLLQQLAMKKNKTKKHKENEALLILTQHQMDPVHKHTHKWLAIEKQRAQGLTDPRTHTAARKISQAAFDTNRLWDEGPGWPLKPCHSVSVERLPRDGFA